MDFENASADVSSLDTPPPPTSATISNWETPTPLKNADVVYGRPKRSMNNKQLLESAA